MHGELVGGYSTLISGVFVSLTGIFVVAFSGDVAVHRPVRTGWLRVARGATVSPDPHGIRRTVASRSATRPLRLLAVDGESLRYSMGMGLPQLPSSAQARGVRAGPSVRRWLIRVSRRALLQATAHSVFAS